MADERIEWVRAPMFAATESVDGCPPKVDAADGCPPKVDAADGCPPKVDAR